MSSQLPPLPPPPRLEVPPPAAQQEPQSPSPAPVVVSPAQVWSAAAQNIVVALVIGGAWFYGKLGSELALPALLLVVGVDFLGRKRLPGSTSLAVAFGASGILSKFPHMGAGILAVIAALGVGGCGGVVAYQETLPKVAQQLEAAAERYGQALATYESVCLPAPAVPELLPACESLADALEAAASGLNVAVESYGQVNELVKELQ